MTEGVAHVGSVVHVYYDGDENDHAAAENLSTHGLHGRAAARLSPACAPRV